MLCGIQNIISCLENIDKYNSRDTADIYVQTSRKEQISFFFEGAGDAQWSAEGN